MLTNDVVSFEQPGPVLQPNKYILFTTLDQGLFNYQSILKISNLFFSFVLWNYKVFNIIYNFGMQQWTWLTRRNYIPVSMSNHHH